MSFKVKANEGWWQNIPLLISRTLEVYSKIERDPVQVASQKIVEHRGWCVKEEELYDPVRELGYLYVPKKLFPGPMFIFPHADLEMKYRAQTNPQHTAFGDSKYFVIGVNQEDFVGPVWLGNSTRTLDLIKKLGYVILVEGGFDLLAAKVAAPELPIMSPLTKTFGKSHVDYLRILGVKTAYLLMDNDKAGNTAADILVNTVKEFKVVKLGCPGSDPSDCLKTKTKKDLLQRVLEGVE